MVAIKIAGEFVLVAPSLLRTWEHRLFFSHHGPHAVVTQSANIAAVGSDDLIEQRELRIASIGHVEPIRFNHRFEHQAARACVSICTLSVIASSILDSLIWAKQGFC